MDWSSEMTLIPQDSTNACWYASALMVWNWKQEHDQACSGPGPDDIPDFVKIHKANGVIPWVRIREFGKAMGMTPAPLVSPSEELLRSWLMVHGPLWTDGVPVDANGNVSGSGHVVVIAGLRGTGNDAEILIYDPWPPNQGGVNWRPMTHLSGILSDGNNPNRNAFILYYP